MLNAIILSSFATLFSTIFRYGAAYGNLLVNLEEVFCRLTIISSVVTMSLVLVAMYIGE